MDRRVDTTREGADMRRSVVLTGTSRGLGEAMFDLFIAAGDRVMALSRSFAPAQLELAAARSDDVWLRETDLSDCGSLPATSEISDFLARDPRSAPTLIHNAGVVTPIGPVGELDPVQVEQATSTNLLAPMLLSNCFLAAVPGPAPRVDVLFVSSGAASRVIDGWAVYSATKAGGERFFDTLAAQYADDPRTSVRVVNPGVMDTDMQAIVRAAEFAGIERYRGLHERGELPPPADVARRIVAEHLPRTDHGPVRPDTAR